MEVHSSGEECHKRMNKKKYIGLSTWNFQGVTVRSRVVVELSYFDRCIMWQTVYSFNNMK